MTSQRLPLGTQSARCPFWYAASATLFAFAISYSRQFILPFVPILPSGDQLGFANAGSRIAAGQLPYRDYFQIVPPGTDLVYAVLIKCFGIETWMPGLVMCFLAAATVLVMTIIAARFVHGPSILLPGLLFTGFILYGSLDATHHWFSTLVTMVALLVLLGGVSSTRIALTGALCGLAACFTQTKGAAAVVAFAAYFVWKNRREKLPLREAWRHCLLLCASAAIVFFAANVFFIQAVGWSQWFFCIMVYPLRYYTAPSINNWRVLGSDFLWHGGMARWVCYPFVYATVPFVYIFVAITLRRRPGSEESGFHESELEDQLLLLVFTGFAMFLAIAAAPSLKRLSTVSPPAMILLAWLLTWPVRTVARIRTALAAGALVLAISGSVRAQTRWRTEIDLPAGRTALTDRLEAEEYRWVLAHTHPEQFFFGMPPMYLPYRMRNPAAVEGLMPSEYTRPEQVAATVQALETHDVPLLILVADGKYPRATGLASDHLAPFRDYLCRNYHLTDVFATGDEVWQRRDPAVPLVGCAAGGTVR
jgi:hypothetical protein